MTTPWARSCLLAGGALRTMHLYHVRRRRNSLLVAAQASLHVWRKPLACRLCSRLRVEPLTKGLLTQPRHLLGGCGLEGAERLPIPRARAAIARALFLNVGTADPPLIWSLARIFLRLRLRVHLTAAEVSWVWRLSGGCRVILGSVAADAIARQHAQMHASVGDEGGEGGARVDGDAIGALDRLQQAKLPRVHPKQGGARAEH